MDHEAIKERLLLLNDREWAEGERQEITAHLQSCIECRKTLERWQRIQSVLARSQRLGPSEVFVDGVMSRLAAREAAQEQGTLRRPWAFPNWLFPALGYGFAFLLMMIAIESREAPMNTAAVLLADVPRSSQWTFVHEQPDFNQLLGATKEDV